MHPARHARGFTLLELMIVVGMAAIVLTISVPFVQRTLHQDATVAAVRTFMDALQNARSIAILGNQAAEVVIRPPERTVHVEVAPARRFAAAPADPWAADAPPPGARPAAQTPPPFSGRLGDDVQIALLDVNFQELKDEEAARVRFFPNGTSDEFTVVFRVGPDQWRKISLDVITGSAALEVLR